MNHKDYNRNNYGTFIENFDNNKKIKIINVGSGGPEKIINLNFDSSNYDISNIPYNKQSPNWKDTFKVTKLENNKISVKRTDINSSWGQGLQLKAVKKLPTAEEIMYMSDIKNIESNKSIDDIQDRKIVNLIKQKLNHLGHDRRQKLSKEIKFYKKNKDIIQQLYNNNHKSDLIKKKQHKELNYNNTQIKSKRNDIITLRRQIEISQNQTIKRNNRLFILKTFFVYLLVLSIPLLLVKNKNITNQIGVISVSIITALFFSIILLNFYRNRNINSLNYNVRDWNKPNLKSLSEE